MPPKRTPRYRSTTTTGRWASSGMQANSTRAPFKSEHVSTQCIEIRQQSDTAFYESLPEGARNELG